MKNNWRQTFHPEPHSGWMNDPNGLCWYKGEYHVFFQYSPDSTDGSTSKYWGHYTSSDLINWTFHGAAVAPDTEYDKNGAYSGCAVITDERMHLFYTGNVKYEGSHDYITSGRGANVIHIASEDPYSFDKKQVLLRNIDYPSFCSCHVRDPKIWSDGQTWYMVLGARTLSDEGCVLIYKSDNLLTWLYDRVITKENFGYMWECPDYFELSDKKFLSISPQGLTHQKTKFQNVYQSGWFDITEKDHHMVPGKFHEWDMGFDFYAPQSFEAPDSRRLMIGWMGLPDIPYENPTVACGWQHCLTCVREITCDDNGNLLQAPVKELKKLRCSQTDLSADETVLVSLPFELEASPQGEFSITIDNGLIIEYNNSDGLFRLQFTDKSLGGGRDTRLCEINRCSSVHVLCDKSSIEIFLNNGSTVLSSRIYPEDESVRLTINRTDAVLWNLRKKEVVSNE
ncbi:MAG: glycoside hydrolase family 32 protein [Oscillospiraceae bacterium]|nr:glycoside hydrolase family 32 protein [Oscillospiraceae bacterium]